MSKKQSTSKLKISGRSSNEQFVRSVLAHPLLPDEETKALLLKAQQGDSDAKHRLVQHNMRLVLSCVNRFIALKEERLYDVFSAGVVGLLVAIRMFDLSRPVKFSTYAVWWIQAKIRVEIEQANPKKTKYKSLVAAYKAASHALYKQKKYKPSEEEVFELLQWDDLSVDRYLASTDTHTLSIDQIETALVHGSLIIDELLVEPAADTAVNQIYQGEVSELIKQNVDRLPPLQKTIIINHYGLFDSPSMTYDELAEKFNITRERVRQVCNSALASLWFYLKPLHSSELP